MKISPIYRNTAQALSAQNIIEQELPYVNALYNHPVELHADISDWLAFFIKHGENLPMYALDRQAADQICADLTRYHSMLREALDKLMKLPLEEVRQWFDCSAARRPEFKTFYDYARAVYAQDSRALSRIGALYGRLDAAVDPESGKVQGVYEFNGDTPVMLF